MLIQVTYVDRTVLHFLVGEDILLSEFRGMACEFGQPRKVDFL